MIDVVAYILLCACFLGVGMIGFTLGMLYQAHRLEKIGFIEITANGKIKKAR